MSLGLCLTFDFSLLTALIVVSDTTGASASVVSTPAPLAVARSNFVLVLSDISVTHVAWRSEEHTSELQSLMRISYAVFCLKKKNKRLTTQTNVMHKTCN